MLNNLEITSAAPGRDTYAQADAIVLLLCRECVPALGKLALPQELAAAVTAYLAQAEAFAAVGNVRTFSVWAEGRLRHIVIAGCGEGSKGVNCKPEAFRRAAGEAARELARLRVHQAAAAGPLLLNPAREHYVQAAAEGFYLGAYQFNAYKSAAKSAPVCRLALLNGASGGSEAVARAEIIASAASMARDMANEPGNMLDPEGMVELAGRTAAECGLEIEVLDERQLAEKKMQAILAVGQGSVKKPRLVTLKYNGAGTASYTAYVGKGITFDSGGISIKPGDNMGEMKDDMTGAAAVLAAIKAAAQLKLPVNLLAVLACAENMPGGRAQRPGDIVRAASGKTIEVISTDAEGRMVLADAVWYACRQGASRVIDIATLTGAVISALGKECSAIVANDDALAEKIKLAGKLAGEAWWQLPALDDCREALKSDAADLLNSAGRAGGCITGGLFVGEFVDAGLPWAHLDIGGTSTAKKTAGYKVKGCTGFGTLTLIRLAQLLAEQ